MRRLATVAALLACAAVARADTSPPDGKSRAGAASTTVLATLERGMCFGTCPVYKVTIYTDGRVEYDGESFVKEKGRRTATLPPAALAAVRKAFADAHYLALDDRYDCYDVTDGPSAATSFFDGKRTKTVHHYYGCLKAPKELSAVEHAIDEAVKVERWVGTEKERDQLRAAGKLR